VPRCQVHEKPRDETLEAGILFPYQYYDFYSSSYYADRRLKTEPESDKVRIAETAGELIVLGLKWTHDGSSALSCAIGVFL
jgi:hypothetical protein